jgi:hypothetical protein
MKDNSGLQPLNLSCLLPSEKLKHLALMNQALSVLPQSLQANSAIVPPLGYDLVLSNPFQFIHESSFHSTLYNFNNLKPPLQKPGLSKCEVTHKENSDGKCNVHWISGDVIFCMKNCVIVAKPRYDNIDSNGPSAKSKQK